MQFVDYHVVALKDLGEHCEECEEHEADFYGLYGVDDQGDAYAIGDFQTREDAELIKSGITT